MLRVFEDVNASDQYLRGIAQSDPKLFLSLVARLIPVASEVTLDQRVTVSVVSAMKDAQERCFNSKRGLVTAACGTPCRITGFTGMKAVFLG